ncbi:MAG: IS4 family transposase [Bacteroidia bacterium]
MKPIRSINAPDTAIFVGFTLNYDHLASVLLSLAGLDRNWCSSWIAPTEFGNQDLNVMLAVAYRHMAIPTAFWILLPKFGNSHTKERIRHVGLSGSVGWDRVAALVADREFIGQEWMEWLIGQNSFYLRLRNNLYRQTAQENNPYRPFSRARPFHQPLLFGKAPKVLGCYVYLAGMRLPKGEFLILACYHRPEQAIQYYKLRWEIETLFGALKSRGFDLEKTHLKDLDRVRKLIALLAIAFIWAYLVGIWKDQHLKPIRILKHKRQNHSFFTYGLSHLKKCLLANEHRTHFKDCLNLLSCT